MIAKIDREKCNGCSICEAVCPEVFKMFYGDRASRALVHTNPVPKTAERFCIDARDCCKPGAIHVDEDS